MSPWLQYCSTFASRQPLLAADLAMITKRHHVKAILRAPSDSTAEMPTYNYLPGDIHMQHEPFKTLLPLSLPSLSGPAFPP